MSDDDVIRLSPSYLWNMADNEHPDDMEARHKRYLTLMREHGHILPKDHPDVSPDRYLPCGWPGPATGRTGAR